LKCRMLMHKEEIIQASKQIFSEFSDTCLQIPDKKFFYQPGDKWSIAQNVDHLTRAVKTTKLAYSLPKIFVRTLFGKANRPSRSFEELVAKYKLKLAQGGKASGPYLPKTQFTKQLALVQKWQKENENYLEAIELKWKDEQLDRYIAPHPLLGKLTLRELCYFTIYHTEHHLNIIKTRLTEQIN
jgi:DinB family protein